MADPILDEDLIIEILQSPINPDTVHRIQTGAMQALIDIYDRKVTREEFLALASPCVALYGQAAKLWILSNIKGVHDSGDLDGSRFDKAVEGLCDLIRKQSETVIELVKRLKLCPTTQDKIH